MTTLYHTGILKCVCYSCNRHLYLTHTGWIALKHMDKLGKYLDLNLIMLELHVPSTSCILQNKRYTFVFYCIFQSYERNLHASRNKVNALENQVEILKLELESRLLHVAVY